MNGRIHHLYLKGFCSAFNFFLQLCSSVCEKNVLYDSDLFILFPDFWKELFMIGKQIKLKIL